MRNIIWYLGKEEKFVYGYTKNYTVSQNLVLYIIYILLTNRITSFDMSRDNDRHLNF